MKTAIVYYSQHHGNTKKLLDAIAEKHDVTHTRILPYFSSMFIICSLSLMNISVIL